MSDENLKQIIKRFNSNVFLNFTTLSNSVIFVKVPNDEYNSNVLCSIPEYNFYFIKNENEKSIGCVFDMDRNLHWYVSAKFRGKHYLSNALRNSILPHLLNERDEIRITIERSYLGKGFDSSYQLALSTGFKETKNDGDEVVLIFNKHS